MYQTEGIAWARYRDSYSKPELLEPGEIYELRVVLYPVSRYFAVGSRIQVEVTRSNFPQFARNLNTGAISDTVTAMRRATTRIYRDAERPSRIVLPLVPARGGHGPGGCSLVEGA